MDAHRLTTDWNTSTTTSSQLGFDPTVLSSFSASGGRLWLSWAVTLAVRDWLAGVQPNYGLLLKRASEPPSAGGLSPFGKRWSQAELRPKLEVNLQRRGSAAAPGHAPLRRGRAPVDPLQQRVRHPL